MEATKLEITTTEQLLKDWECLNHLTEREREKIIFQLHNIAKTAVKEYKEICNKIDINL
jgi:hypothetical protein